MKSRKYTKTFEEFTTSYLLGSVKYQWLKTILKTFHKVDYKDDAWRLNILSQRRPDLRLSEFKHLYDYWNFCTVNQGTKLAYNNIENYKSVIKDWVWYLIMCQLFPEELKNTSTQRDLYTSPYNQIKTLPKLTGDLNKDLSIFEGVIREYFFASESPVRNALILYYIHFKGDARIF